MKRWLSGLGILACAWSILSCPAVASAATVDLDEEEEATAPASTEEGEVIEQKTDAEDEITGQQKPVALPEEEAEEEASGMQILIGARYRLIVAPQFLINAFGVSGARDVLLHGVGAELGVASKNFELVFSPWFADYGLQETPFKGANDGQEAWELVQSNLKALYLTADVTWRKAFARDWDWTIGVSGGVGIVMGNLQRNEAVWVNGHSPTNPGDPYTDLARCAGPGNPNLVECPSPGDYGPANAWPVYPWLSFQTGLRYQPAKQFVARLDFGAGSSGFWFGLGADYGL